MGLEVSPERRTVSCRIGVHPGTVLREDVAVYDKGGRPQLPQVVPGEFSVRMFQGARAPDGDSSKQCGSQVER